MSLSLNQKLLENTQKQYAMLKRQSLQPTPINKNNRISTEEQTKLTQSNSFDLQNQEQSKKMQIMVNIQKENKKKDVLNNISLGQRKQSSQITTIASAKEKGPQNIQTNKYMQQRKSLGQLMPIKMMSTQNIKLEGLQSKNGLKSTSSNTLLTLGSKKEEQKIAVWESEEQNPSNEDVNRPQLTINSEQESTPDQMVIVKQSAKVKNPVLRSSFLSQIPYYEQKAQQKRQNFQIKLQEKKEAYKNFLGEMDTRRETFSKFSFKSYEIDENPYLNPLMQKVNNLQLKGSMNVIDLWEDKALKKYLNYSKLKDGKYMLRGIAQQINQEQMQKRRDQPTIFTKKDENILEGKLQDKDKINSFLKQMNEDYSKNDKLLDRQIQKSGLSQAIPRTSVIIPAESNFQNVLNHKRKSEVVGLNPEQDQPFDDIQFIKNFFMKAHSLGNILSFSNNFLSPYYPSSSKKSPIVQPQQNTPSKSSRQQKEPYFFPSTTPFLDYQSQQNQKNNQSQTYLNQVNNRSQQFLSIPTSLTESSPLKISTSRSQLFENQRSKYNLNDEQQQSTFGSNSKLFLSSDLSSQTNLHSRAAMEQAKQTIMNSKKQQLKTIQNFQLKNSPQKIISSSSSNRLQYRPLRQGNQNYKFYQNQNKLSLEEINSERRTSLNSSRDYDTPQNRNQKKAKDQTLHLAQMNNLFKEIDTIQKEDIHQKKKMDDLIEKIQDRVITSIQNQKKKILDNDRMKNLTNVQS